MGNRIVILSLVVGLILNAVAVAKGAEGKEPAKTIVDLQQYRRTVSVKYQGAAGQSGVATLIDLNPNVRGWYLLQLTLPGEPGEVYHLENAYPSSQGISMKEGSPYGIVVTSGTEKVDCRLWGPDAGMSLEQAKRSGTAYAPLCGGRLYLRNPVKGHRTPIESVSEFLRDQVPGGEKVVSFVKDTFFAYLYQRKAEEHVQSGSQESSRPKGTAGGPVSALIEDGQRNRLIKPIDLAIDIEGAGPIGMSPGAWYAAKGNPGIYASVLVPGGIAPEILRKDLNIVSPLDAVEMEELVYLVAFDLSLFDLHYTVGTDDPGVGWSARVNSEVRKNGLPGPDGIGGSAPLARTGLISPIDVPRTVATFTGGFKRHHGAFKYGELSVRNHGSHYGFLEEGVLFSTLEPGLATIYALTDGRVDMKTWTGEDDKLLPGIACARQNGVPLVAGFESGMSLPGSLVARWGPGNWSGSEEEELRTMRAGVGLQELKGKRFLIYAFFWSATPSAMARVFEAYQCRYAMQLDMNALVHTYLAVYKRQDTGLYVQHLIKGMSQDDVSIKGRYIPRFLGFSDDRDFFYLTRKEKP